MTTLSKVFSPKGVEKVKEQGYCGYVGKVWIGTKRVQKSRLVTIHATQFNDRYFITPKDCAFVAYRTAVEILKAMAMTDDEAKETLKRFQELVNDLEIVEQGQSPDKGKHLV